MFGDGGSNPRLHTATIQSTYSAFRQHKIRSPFFTGFGSARVLPHWLIAVDATADVVLPVGQAVQVAALLGEPGLYSPATQAVHVVPVRLYPALHTVKKTAKN